MLAIGFESYFKGNVTMLGAIFVGISILIHISADVFLMMMNQEFGKGNPKQASVYQFSGNLLFIAIGIFTLIVTNANSYYIWTNAGFLAAALFNVAKFHFNISINWRFVLAINVVMMLSLMDLKLEWWQWMQIIGFVIASTGFSLASRNAKDLWFQSVAIIGIASIGIFSLTDSVMSLLKTGAFTPAAVSHFLINGIALLNFIANIPNFLDSAPEDKGWRRSFLVNTHRVYLSLPSFLKRRDE